MRGISGLVVVEPDCCSFFVTFAGLVDFECEEEDLFLGLVCVAVVGFKVFETRLLFLF